ncbi:GNAT family N-acetyltransferase [Streptomyces mirabilis]|uniref:GNAT family N-acetyltransferase n=1 Tax=Streptomyces mirabilis TaxID=68239 RepID=UPI0036BCA30D
MSLRRLNRWQAEELRENLADLYMESCATAPGWDYRGRKDFLRRLTRDTWRPGFAMLTAEAPDLVGYAFGFPVRRDGSWWSGFRGTLPQDVGQLTASGQVFAISGIVVRPSERHHGLADRLQERLLTDHRASLGATLVDRTHRAACAGFRSRGWHDIGLVYRPPGPTVLRALVLPLGEWTAAEPGGLTHHARDRWPREDPG